MKKITKKKPKTNPMSATRYKRPHVDIFICIEMGRERNQGIIKQAQRRAAAEDPGTKVTGEFSTKGHIFPPNAQNGFLLLPSF